MRRARLTSGSLSETVRVNRPSGPASARTCGAPPLTTSNPAPWNASQTFEPGRRLSVRIQNPAGEVDRRGGEEPARPDLRSSRADTRPSSGLPERRLGDTAESAGVRERARLRWS